MLQFDVYFFYLLNSVAGQYPIIDAAIIFFAEMALPLLCLMGVLFLRPWRWNNIVVLFLSMAAAWSTNALIGMFFFRQRPYVDLENTHLLIGTTFGSKSFPSDHTVLSFAFAFALFLIHKKLGVAALIIAFLIGLSRIMAGVHYPLDVLAAIGIGCIWAWFIKKIL